MHSLTSVLAALRVTLRLTSSQLFFLLFLFVTCLVGVHAAPFGYYGGGKGGFGGGGSVLMPPPIDPTDPAFSYVGGFMGPLYGGRGYYSGPGLNLAMQGLQGYGPAVYGWGPRGYMGYGPMTPYDMQYGLVRPSDRRGVPSLNTRVTQAFFAQLVREQLLLANATRTAGGYGPGFGAAGVGAGGLGFPGVGAAGARAGGLGFSGLFGGGAGGLGGAGGASGGARSGAAVAAPAGGAAPAAAAAGGD